MSGFTLYETLRILVPGLLATLIGRLTLWIVSITTGLDFAQSLPLFDNAVLSLGLSLFLGLLLYSVDLPVRLMIAKDGASWGQLPSNKLLDLLGKETIWRNAPIGLYFLLSDRYLPNETHRRIYLFGSLFRVFVDLRFLLAVAAVAGCALSLLTASQVAAIEWSWGAALFALTPLVGIALLGIPGEREHKINKLLKNEATPDPLGDYRKQRNAGISQLKWLYLLIAGTGSAAAAMFLWKNTALTLLASIPAVVNVAVWFWIEIGKPNYRREERGDKILWNELDMRSFVMLKTGIDHHEPNFWPIQRTVADIVFFLPWLGASSVALARMGRPSQSVILWALLILPCSLIASVRKHETRLLATYREQSNWLEHHSSEIRRIASTGQLPEHWS